MKVELHNAYVWDCEWCGRENFVRAIMVEMTEEDSQAMAEKYPETAPEAWQTGHWETYPDEVTCQHCGKEFETKGQESE